MDQKAEIRETEREKGERDRKEEPPNYSLTYLLVKERGTGKPNLPSRKQLLWFQKQEGPLISASAVSHCGWNALVASYDTLQPSEGPILD